MDAWLDGIRERWGRVVLGLLVAGFALRWWQQRPVPHPPGVLAPADPEQGPPDPPAPWTHRGHRITPLATFHVRARILSMERYRFDRGAELSPVDYALGWGPLSDSRVLADLTIRQGDRWYFWSASRLPLPPSEVVSHSANMHLIPATPALANRLTAARVGQVAELSGSLVRVDGADGWHWVSSLTRSDTGDGSCEVFWVDSARLTDR